MRQPSGAEEDPVTGSVRPNRTAARTHRSTSRRSGHRTPGPKRYPRPEENRRRQEQSRRTFRFLWEKTCSTRARTRRWSRLCPSLPGHELDPHGDAGSGRRFPNRHRPPKPRRRPHVRRIARRANPFKTSFELGRQRACPAQSRSNPMARRRSFARPNARCIRMRSARSGIRISRPSGPVTVTARSRTSRRSTPPHGNDGVQQSPLARGDSKATLGRRSTSGSNGAANAPSSPRSLQPAATNAAPSAPARLGSASGPDRSPSREPHRRWVGGPAPDRLRPRRPGSLLHGDHRRPTALSARSDGADPERPFSCALVRRASGFAVVTRSGPTSPSTAPRTAPSRRTTTATCHPATRAPRTSPPRRRSAHPPRATTTPTA